MQQSESFTSSIFSRNSSFLGSKTFVFEQGRKLQVVLYHLRLVIESIIGLEQASRPSGYSFLHQEDTQTCGQDLLVDTGRKHIVTTTAVSLMQATTGCPCRYLIGSC